MTINMLFINIPLPGGGTSPFTNPAFGTSADAVFKAEMGTFSTDLPLSAV